MKANDGMKAWLICGSAGLVLALAAPVVAQDKAAPVVLASHRIVYDLSLDQGAPSRDISSARGRIVIDFSGDACDGYALSFRQVTELGSEIGPRVIDARTTSFEDGTAKTYRFKTESSTAGAPAETVDGTAKKAGEGYEVTLRAPEAETHRETVPTMFPSEQMKALIAAARAGKTTLNARLYDGANTGKDVYETLSVIGRPVTGEPAEPALRRPELKDVKRWPVTMSYFKVGSEESTPAYTVSFDLYENGIGGSVKLDYGSFALRGTVTNLDLRPASDCAK